MSSSVALENTELHSGCLAQDGDDARPCADRRDVVFMALEMAVSTANVVVA